MALQPKDLAHKVIDYEEKNFKAAEAIIDNVLAKTYTGSAVQIDVTSKFPSLTSKLMAFIKQKYHGWTVSQNSGSDCRDGDSWNYLVFTPKPIQNSYDGEKD